MSVNNLSATYQRVIINHCWPQTKPVIDLEVNPIIKSVSPSKRLETKYLDLVVDRDVQDCHYYTKFSFFDHHLQCSEGSKYHSSSEQTTKEINTKINRLIRSGPTIIRTFLQSNWIKRSIHVKQRKTSDELLTENTLP